MSLVTCTTKRYVHDVVLKLLAFHLKQGHLNKSLGTLLLLHFKLSQAVCFIMIAIPSNLQC